MDSAYLGMEVGFWVEREEVMKAFPMGEVKCWGSDNDGDGDDKEDFGEEVGKRRESAARGAGREETAKGFPAGDVKPAIMLVGLLFIVYIIDRLVRKLNFEVACMI